MNIQSQPVYSFVSGKNWKLSLAEIISYFDSRNITFEVSEFSRSYFTIRTQRELEPSIIDELGGTLKIAKSYASVSSKQVNLAFEKGDKEAKKMLKADLPLDELVSNIASADSGKTIFGVSVYWVDPAFKKAASMMQRFFGSSLKDELKNQGKKARFMGFPHDRENPQLTPVEVLKQGLLENRAEILLNVGEKTTQIGTTIAVHNPFEFQKRDLEKPVQRKIFGISPRVAKIMINLTHCTSGKVFLDPFCGVGTFLQEALLSRAKVVGLDINKWCVESAKRNLEWISSEYSLKDADYAVVQGDVRRLTSKIGDDIDCIATEPDLGPALREFPTVPYATKIVENLEPLFESFLGESYEILRCGSFLAVVSPFIKTRSGQPVTMKIEQIAADSGFNCVKPFEKVNFVEEAGRFPLRDLTHFIDVDERHKIGRKINVFQKAE